MEHDSCVTHHYACTCREAYIRQLEDFVSLADVYCHLVEGKEEALERLRYEALELLGHPQRMWRPYYYEG